MNSHNYCENTQRLNAYEISQDQPGDLEDRRAEVINELGADYICSLLNLPDYLTDAQKELMKDCLIDGSFSMIGEMHAAIAENEIKGLWE